MDSVVHFEIPADDMEKAKKFYKAVFGWKMSDMSTPQGPYMMVQTAETDKEGDDAHQEVEGRQASDPVSPGDAHAPGDGGRSRNLQCVRHQPSPAPSGSAPLDTSLPFSAFVVLGGMIAVFAGAVWMRRL